MMRRCGLSLGIDLEFSMCRGALGRFGKPRNIAGDQVDFEIDLVAGAALGANQSVSRTLLGRFTPLGRQGEFFGFFSVAGKFAAILGPIVYGEVTAWTGSQRWAVLSMAVFFLVGLAVFWGVDERRGMAAAQE